MARKNEAVVELAVQTARQISANSGNYMAFLTTAAHNFKYSFRDQLLIYAQKPDATACAQIDLWNKYGRRVKRGTTGIALLVDTDRGYKLRYVFDMSDTNSHTGRTIPIWQMKPQYEGAVAEALENSYGEFADKSDFAGCLLQTAKVIVEDNFGDYFTELCRVREGSLLEELDDFSAKTWFRGLLENSVAYVMLTRCGIDLQDYFTGEDFAHIYDFNTPETLSILGGAVSDISEMPLREIASTVLNLYRGEEKENRTFAGRADSRYNDGRVKHERSVEHGTDISNGGRLPPAQPGSAGGPEGRKIWDAAAQLPQKPSERLLHGDASQRQAGRPSGEDRPAGHRDGGAADGADGAGTGRNRGTESVRSDEMGGSDEQHPGSGGGSGTGGADLHRRVSDQLPTEEEQNAAIQAAEDEQSSAFAVSQEDIDAVLLHGSGVADGKFRIFEQFLKQESAKENAGFLKNEYGVSGYSVHTTRKLDVWTDSKGIKVTFGQDIAAALTWKKAAKRIGELLAADRYLSPAEKEKYQEYHHQGSVPGPLAAPLEPAYNELNPPPPLKKEYRFALGDAVYLGTQEYELLAYDEQTVRLFDPAFPIFNKELSREEFDRLLAENPLNDGLFQVVEEAVPAAAEAAEPDTPQAVGRIDFLGTNGTVGDSVEYTDAERFVAAIKEENWVGTPMCIIIYRNKEGQTIPLTFVKDLDPPPKGFRVVDYAERYQEEQAGAPGYKLGFGHMGNGVTVWNSLELEGGDYKTVAHISPDRTVKFYEDGLPEAVRARIEEFAATSTMTISGTQDAPIFSAPSLVREPAIPPAEAGEPTYPPRELPYIFCEWSESIVFQDKTAYTLHEFDRLMKQADDEYVAGKTAAMAKYGTWQEWYNANDPEYNSFLGYDKVKFTLVMPDGRTFTERQDIGDGDGGMLDFLSQYDKYRKIVPILQEAIRKEVEAAWSVPAPQPGPDSGRFWDAYNSIKERNPDSLVLYQVGDFFELYGGVEGGDAWNAAKALDLTLTKRNIPEYGRVPMCGFPAQKLEDYVKELNSKGYDVVVAALDGNQHKTTTMPASPMEKARKFINDFCMMKHGEEADFSDLHHVDLAFGSTGVSEHTVNIGVELISCRLTFQVNGETVLALQCRDLDDLNEYLANLDKMIDIAEDKYRWQSQKALDTIGSNTDGQHEEKNTDTTGFQVGDIIQIGEDGYVPEYCVLKEKAFVPDEKGQLVPTYTFLTYWDRALKTPKSVSTVPLPVDRPVKVIGRLSHKGELSKEANMLKPAGNGQQSGNFSDIDLSAPERQLREQATPNDEGLTELQREAVEIARKYESLSMQEKIGVIAQVFGCTSGKIETSLCSGKWRGTSDVSIRFDNRASLCIGNDRTPQARTAKVQNEFINAALMRYNPEIVAAAKEAALHALRKREAKDNEIAVQKGLKPYTLLNVEITDGTGDRSGLIGWYYVTLAVDGKIFALLESGLNYEIANGKTGEAPQRKNYFVAGGLKEEEVDFVFHNVGHSSTSTIFSLRISDAVRERAERTLAERTAANTPPASERFSIIETERGYAVWDDVQGGIHVDGESVQEEFTSEWQAEDYLKQVRQAAEEKSAESPAVGRAPIGDIPLPQSDQRKGVEKASEPAEKETVAEKGAESLADGHNPDGEDPTLAPSAPQRRPKVSPFVLHPEIPNADRHEYRITNDAIGEGMPGERYKNNIRAIRLLKKLEREERLATPEEQAVLAQYVGWGGLADCFDERHSKYTELKALLDEDEYAAARESTLTAFYTPPVVIRSIYQALENMGFKTGNLLEPSCGIGNFIGMRPESLAGSKIYGIELDGISGRIARQLYQKSSIAVQGFEKTDLPDSFFDAAIGNVPFGAFKVTDKRYDKQNFFIHDYFFARTLDKVRPGGIVAFVTSKGTMDKENPNVRKYIAQRADLLGAIRLPNNAFKAAAGTEVTSDILFLQKREALASEEPDWVHLNTDENGLKMNQYFIDHRSMVMGEMREVSGPHGPETACLPREGQDLGEQLAAAIQNIQGTITEYVLDDPEAEGEDKSIPADPNVRNFSYTIVDGEIYYRENSRMNPVEVSVTAVNRIKGLIAIRDCVRTLIEYQTEDWPAEDIQAQQKKLNTLYDAYVEKYGRINSRGNSLAFRMDSAYFLLASLEVLDDERNFVRKADMFTKRTIKQKVAVTSVDTASEALAVSLAEKAKVDMAFMMELTGKTEQEIFAELTGVIFLNPMHGYGGSTAAKYLTADEYLSGNVREKLEWARRSAELNPEDYTANVEALEQVQPADLNASEISVRLGSIWLPPDVVERFVFELLDTAANCQKQIRVHYSQYTGEWNVKGKSTDRVNIKASSTYGTTRINAYKIIEDTLNLRDVRIFDYIQDENGKRKPILNKKETAIAQGKQELIKQAFQDWIWKDPERRERLTTLYNERFNNLRPREYDGSHISFVGMNPEITLKPHQVNAVARILYGGNTLLGHVVGAGKTWEMVAAAQESKRLGLCQKSLFVVPNHLTEQWASEYLQLYPSANILVATKKDFETKNRKRFCGRIATGDYDAIIIGHSQFEKIPLSIERQRFTLEQQLDEITRGISELKAQKGERFSVKQLEGTRKNIREKLASLNDQSRKDDVVTFEELGVDRIFIDEAHYYKNLASFSKMRNVGGISQTEAQKSSDLYMKCRYLDELTGGRGVIFATGTPISNTMVEMYTMQKYLQYGLLQEKELLHFDAWASTFGETVTAIELAPEGTGYRAKTRFARFHNLPELMAMFKEVADIQTADMLDLPVPKATYHTVSLKPSELQRQMVAALAERAEKVRNREVRSDQDNMLLITNDGRKLALDQRLLNPMLPDSDTGKINACAENVFEIWQNTADQRSTQMVFCDLSTPKGNGDFNVYDALRDKLIAKGIPAEEIAYVHSANTEAKKKELFGKVRSGQIRVLLGSTQKMGAGTNAQRKLVALHHCDCPWRPADLQQRNGRIMRQGNENAEVDIYTYVTEDTFDSYLYQLVESKQKFIGQIMTSKSPARSIEDIDETALSYAEIKALCAGDERIKEKMDLDIDVQRLKLLKASHLSQKYSLEDNIVKYFPQQIAIAKGKIKSVQEHIAIRDANTHPNKDGFSPMVVRGVTYTEKKAAGTAILAARKALMNDTAISLGEYRGFQMELFFNPFYKEYTVRLAGVYDHVVNLGTDIFGNIQRLDNLINEFERDLNIAQSGLTTYETQLASAKIEVEKPFPQEDELKTKSARLDELNILLNIDKQENEIVDGDVGDAAEAPARDGPDRER